MSRQAELNVIHPTLVEDGESVLILDQTRLPQHAVQVRLNTAEDAAHAIRSMQVRGAPLIGVTAAYGVALGLRHDESDSESDSQLKRVIDLLAATRPTAVNLHWALARMERVLKKFPQGCNALALVTRREASTHGVRRERAWHEAAAIATEDIAANAAIGAHGLRILQGITPKGDALNLMTHCNAGRLATVAHGTALAPIYAAHAAGIAVHVWVSETRPRNQGLLTAWELAEAGVPHTLIADNAAGLLIMQGKVDMLIVGADRIAANGDTANKVGTYLKALAAAAHGVPFYVAAPLSTIDFSCASGQDVPIEERAAAELGAGDVPVVNPAFDITPAHLITGIISERGVVAPEELAQWKT
ncbi:MAG TPA: S-methyl-5-thioribose-1-phosphate isomerase [Rugosibacter sp.]|nr:S-methyl-5-thioribose-1-phosphate isomerase [Rugosibacter sp.]HQN45887.1 S-methyl-5-thioribose-1-phosphate isomerase [Rugosibacter sp.]HQQ35926.1 S-methyl-5-thioribose-1-phosphate isomerase [Rugosibacter sp.]